MVEIFFAECEPSVYLLQMINMTGWNGMTFFEPWALDGMEVRFTGISPVSAEVMTEEGLKPVPLENGCLKCPMKKGQLYQAFKIQV